MVQVTNSALLPRITDLQLLINDIEKSGRDPSLAKMARSTWQAQSCFADIHLAREMLAELMSSVSSDEGHKTIKRVVTEVALLNSTIVLYARATDTRSRVQNDRGPVDIRKDLSPLLHADHHAIVSTRDKAIAHVEPNQNVEELMWHRSELLALQVGKSWAPLAGTRWVTVNEPAIERLERLVPIAFDLIKKAADKRLAALAQRLRAEHNVDVEEALVHRPFDAIAQAGSLDAALAAYGRPHVRGMRTGFNHPSPGFKKRRRSP